MRRNTAHVGLHRLAVAFLLAGLLSLLAAPLAFAQSGPSDRSADRDNPIRNTESLAAECPDGFRLTDDKAACVDDPVIVTTQEPVECEVGLITDDRSACYTEVSYISQAPTAQTEVIDAYLSPGKKAFCPAGFTLTGTTCVRTEPVNPEPFPATIETSPGQLYCPDGGEVQPGDLCLVPSVKSVAGEYVPASEDSSFVCPVGTIPGQIVDGLCRQEGAAPLPKLDGVCLTDEISLDVHFPNGETTSVCYPAIEAIPSATGVPATCNGVITSAPASACTTDTLVQTSTPASTIGGAEPATCPFGAELLPDQTCLELAEVPAGGATTVTCPTGYEMLDTDTCSAMVAVPDNQVPPEVTTQPATFYCPDGSSVLGSGRCPLPDMPPQPGIYTPGIAATPGTPGTPATQASCPAGTDPAVVVNGLCLVLGAVGEPLANGASCGPTQIVAPVSYASAGVEASLCYDALPQTPGTPAVPALPGIAGIPATCEGVPTAAPASECYSLASTQPAASTAPTSTSTCPFGSTPKANGTVCSKPQPPEKVQVVATVATTYDSAFCPSGYAGPSSNNQCTRTILTAQPDVPVCVQGTLLDIGNGFVCLLDNSPVAPAPVAVPTCPKGDYDATLNLCKIVLDATDTDPQIFQGPQSDVLPVFINAFGHPDQLPAAWQLDVASTCGDPTTILVSTAEPSGDREYFVEFPVQQTDDDSGAACTYIVTAAAVAGWESSLPAGGVQFTPAVSGVPLLFVEFVQPGYGEIAIYKTLYPGEQAPPDQVRFTVEGVCLDSAIVTAVSGADAVAGTTLFVPVALVDDLGNACVYRVSHEAIEGVSSYSYASTGESTQVIMNTRRTVVDFVKVQGGLELGTIRIHKLSRGDASAAPAYWEFTISSPCLDEPLQVEVLAAPTFVESTATDVEVPYWPDDMPYPCEYNVMESPVDGFAATHSGGYGTYVGLYSGPLGEVYYENVHLASASGSLTIYVDQFGAVGEAAVSFMISSDCLESSITIDVRTAASYHVEDVDDLPISDADGAICDYRVEVLAAAGLFLLDSVSPVVNLAPGGHGSFAAFTGIAPGYTGDLAIAKNVDLVDPQSLPDQWEFTVSSPCFDPIVVPLDPSGNSTVLQVPYADDAGLCEITVTETPVAGFAISAPVTQTASSPYIMFSQHSKVNVDAGLLGDIRVDVVLDGEFAVPEVFLFSITSPCLETPLAIDVPTSGHELIGRIDTVVPNLPVNVGELLCGYSITPVGIAGLEFLIAFGQPYLEPFGSRITVAVGLEGTFGDNAAPTLSAPTLPAPTPSVPTVPGSGGGDGGTTPPAVTPPVAPSPTTPAPVPSNPTSPSAPIAPSAPITPSAPIVMAVGVAATSPSTGHLATVASPFGGTASGHTNSTYTAPAVSTHSVGANAPAPSANTALAITGAQSTQVASFGVVLISIGAALMLFVRRRDQLAWASYDPFADSGE